MSEPIASNPCFVCGGASSRGMRLVFERDDTHQRIVGRFRLGADYQGGPGFVHRGIVATLLDEAMGKVSRFRDVRAMTAELSIEYLKPVRVDEEICVEAFESRREGRQLFHEGEIRDVAGKLLARGRGRFVVVDPAKFRL